MAKGNRQVKYSDDKLAEALDAAQGSVKYACETLNMGRRAMQYRITVISRETPPVLICYVRLSKPGKRLRLRIWKNPLSTGRLNLTRWLSSH